MKKILFVCLGNICRSPMAEFVMKEMLKKRHLHHVVEVASAATSTYELGNPVHRGTRAKLHEHGISCAGKTARQLTRSDYQEYDYLIGMDDSNMRDMRRMLGGDPEGKLYKLLALCGESADVADPWYTGDFEATWQDVCRGCEALLKRIEKELSEEKKHE